MSIQYSDLFNLSNINTDSLTVNNLDVINETVQSSLALAFATPNLPLKTNAGRNVISAKIDLVDDVTNILPISLGGTNNNIALNNNRIMISSGGKISESSALLDGQILIGATGNLPVPGNILGKNNQISVTNGANSIQLNLPQDIATTSAVTFGDITNNGLTASSIVATDASKKLISRTIQGTNNQINVNTVGTTTTFSTPQDIATTSNVTFNSLTTTAIESVGSSLAIGSNNATQNINIGSGTGLQTVNIGSSGSGVTTINIGAGGDIVNIGGSLNYIQTTDLEVKDNLITINKGSAGSGTARGAGLNIRDNSVDNQGYITVSNSGNFFNLKAPENNFVLSTPSLTANSSVVTTTENQTIGGVKTFSTSPIIDVSGGAVTTWRATGQSGFQWYSISDADGFNVWSIPANTSIFRLKNTLTPSRLLTTDASNYLASASIGTSDLVLTSGNQTIGGNKTFSGTTNLSALTASTYLGLDASKNVISLSDPATNLLNSNNTWNGTNTFWGSTFLYNDVEILGAGSTNKLVMTNGTKKIISSSWGESDLVLRSTNQTIGGVKTFTSPLFVDTTGSAYARLRITGQSGFDLYTFGDASGFGVWSLSAGAPILQLRNLLTANRMVITDASNYLASASFGASDVVLTSTNQTITGNKTFSDQVVTGKFVRATNIIANPFNIANGNTLALQYANVISAGIGVVGNSQFTTTTTGNYLVNWTVRVSVVTVWEVSTWIELGSNPGTKFGLTAIPPGTQYVSSSTILNCGADTIRVMVFNGRGDGASVRVVNTDDNQLYIKYIGTN